MPCVGGIPAQKVLRHRDVERAVLPGRVLVMLAGSLRGTEHSWTTIIERLILPHRATLMMILAEPLVQALPRNSKDVTDSAFRRAVLLFYTHLGRHARHMAIVPEFTDWADALDLISANGSSSRAVVPWRNRTIRCPRTHWEPSPLGGVYNLNCRQRQNTNRGWCSADCYEPDSQMARVSGNVSALPSSGSSAIVGVYRWFAKRMLLQQGLLPKFDWFVYTRTDAYYLCELWLPIRSILEAAMRAEEPLAIVPVGEDWGGLSERFLVASRAAIVPALSTLEAWVAGHAPLANNPELQLLLALRAACVRVLRVPRTAFVVQPARGRGRHRPTAASATFEREQSNWGGCMHAPSAADTATFRLPAIRAPEMMMNLSLCPKYAAAWFLADTTCLQSPR
jgi:hypothetical protein